MPTEITLGIELMSQLIYVSGIIIDVIKKNGTRFLKTVAALNILFKFTDLEFLMFNNVFYHVTD